MVFVKPMRLRIAADFASTVASVIFWFHSSLRGKTRLPCRLAFRPRSGRVVAKAEAAFTVIVNCGKATLLLPSVTEIRISSYEPTCAAVGVPYSRPVVRLNDAQTGL